LEKTLKEVVPDENVMCYMDTCDDVATFKYTETENGKITGFAMYCSRHAGVISAQNNVPIS
jgi:hypothetical protein